MPCIVLCCKVQRMLASSLSIAWADRHGALHRAVVHVLQVQASSRCTARFATATVPCTALSFKVLMI